MVAWLAVPALPAFDPLGPGGTFYTHRANPVAVKNQYFGAPRDLFKLDLAIEVLQRTGLSRFTYIPMLTRDTDGSHVLRTDLEEALAGRENVALRTYLEDRLHRGRRSIYETGGGFELPEYSRIHFEMFRPRFQDEVRLQYFLAVPKEDLREAVILLAPDEGLWTPASGAEGERYLRYDEVRYLYDEMDQGSVLVIFQHLPERGRYEAVSAVLQQLKGLVTRGRPPLWVADRRMALFLLTKDNGRQGEVERAVTEYQRSYYLRLDDD